MLARALIIAAALAGLYFLFRRLRNSSWGSQLGRVGLAMGIVGFLLLLTIRGGAEIALPLLVVLAPLLLRWLNGQLSSSSRSTSSSKQQSAVTTRFLHMTLDHATGAMTGQIQEGQFAGRALHELTFAEKLLLWRECQADPQSAAVLEAYLDRHTEPTWREQVGENNRSESTARSETMNRTEAYQILGVPPSATREDIQAAYRRLIQKLHPDQGGSAYLATQLNRARDLLLDRGSD